MANPKAKMKRDGNWVTREMDQMYDALEEIVGWPNGALTIMQGIYSGSVSVSAGTHAGTGASDLTANDEKLKVQILCDLGDCRWIRPAIRGTWSRHNHGVKNYDSSAARAARAQCASFMRRRNGLRGDGPNHGYNPPVYPYFKPDAYKGNWTVKVGECGGYAKATSAAGINKKKTYKKGDVLRNVATVTVKGKDWVVCTNGKRDYWFVYKDNLQSGIVKYGPAPVAATSRTAPVTVMTPTPEATSPAPAPKTSTVDKPPTPSPKVKAAPAPKKSVTLNLTLGLHNVCRRQSWLPGWVPDWSQRLVWIAARAKKNKLNMLLTQEQGATKDAQAIADRLGGDFRSILHGDDGLLTMGNIFNKKDLPLKREGKFETGPGPTHDWSTYTEHNIPGADHTVAFVNTHLWYQARSKTKNPNASDKRRRASFDAILDKCEQLFDNKTIVFIGGDMNCAFQDSYDAANSAAYAHPKSAFRDLELYAKKADNVQYSTGQKESVYSDLKPNKGGRQIDRVMVDKKWIDNGTVTVNWRKVDLEGILTSKGTFYKTKLETDHLSAVFGITIKVPAR